MKDNLIASILTDALTAIRGTDLKADNTDIMIYWIESLLQTLGIDCQVGKGKPKVKTDDFTLFKALVQLGGMADTLGPMPAPENMRFAINAISEEVAIYANQVFDTINASLVESELDLDDFFSEDGIYHFEEGQPLYIHAIGLFLQKKGDVFFNVKKGSHLKGIPYLIARYNIQDSFFSSKYRNEIPAPISQDEIKVAKRAVRMLRKAPTKKGLSNLLADVIENFFEKYYGIAFDKLIPSTKKVKEDQLFLTLYQLSSFLTRTTRFGNLCSNPEQFAKAMNVRVCLTDYVLNTIKKVSLPALKEGKQMDNLKFDVGFDPYQICLPSLSLKYKIKQGKAYLCHL